MMSITALLNKRKDEHNVMVPELPLLKGALLRRVMARKLITWDLTVKVLLITKRSEWLVK
jgi:hypothetical protein